MRARPRNCPECGSDRVAEIVYGLPTKELAREVEENADNPKIVLGGCCISPGSPRWNCNECGHRWGEITLP